MHIEIVALLSIKTSFKAFVPPSPSDRCRWWRATTCTCTRYELGPGSCRRPTAHTWSQRLLCVWRELICVFEGVFQTLTWPVGMLLVNNKDKCRIRHLRTVVILMNREMWHHLALPLLLTASRERRTNNNTFAFNANRGTRAQSSPFCWLHIWHLQHGDRAKNQDDQANQEDFGQRRPRQMITTEMLNSEGVCFSTTGFRLVSTIRGNKCPNGSFTSME